MTTDSHSRGSRSSHKVKREDAKTNGIWRQLSDEEYKREKDEIEVHLEVIMDLLHKKKEDKRCGFFVRRKLR